MSENNEIKQKEIKADLKDTDKSTVDKEKVENKKVSLEEKLKETESKLLRSLAEIENQRRRFEREIKDAFEFGSFNFAKESLAILDNLQRAKEAIKNDKVLKENKDLEDVILAPMKNLMDGPLEEVLETVSPVLPVVIISVSEGRKVLLGRQTFQVALKESLERALKSGVAIGIGGILALLNAGIISLPTTLLAHIGIDRHQNYKRLNEKVNKDIDELRCLGDRI